ncbi:MAG: UV DNA damage repair endonuclease UvsE [Eubacteriales bacterium]
MSIGYACIALGVQNAGFSRCSLKCASVEKIREVIGINLSALSNVIDYNIKNSIMLFRISSDIIPFGSHPINTVDWQSEYKEELIEIGRKIISSGMRVSMHPGQYTVINSNNPKVVENSILDLEYHAAFLDSLGVDTKNKIIIHVGGLYGDKNNSIKVFLSNYSRLNDNVKKRLVLENDDKSYNIEDVLSISNEIEIPVIFDNLHHKLNNIEPEHSDTFWIRQCDKTWKEKDGRQKVHYSQQKTGFSNGAHSETILIDKFAKLYNEIIQECLDCDIMLEVKDKNLSAVKCINTCVLNCKVKELEVEWARYKYYVLSKSSKLYDGIRKMMKEKNETSSLEFYNKIEEALFMQGTRGSRVNAAEHIWGYFKKNHTTSEKKRYEKLITSYKDGSKKYDEVRNHLLKCAKRVDNQYLINSLFFYI